MSAQVAFLALCSVWMALRVVFFVSVQLSYTPPWIIVGVYQAAVNVEFGVFSLLAAYMGSLILKTTRMVDWKAYLATRVQATYIGLNSLLAVLYVLFVYWVSVQDGDTASDRVNHVRSIFTAVVFSVLEVLLAIAYFRLARLLSNHPSLRIPFQTFGSSQRSVLALLAALLVLFLSRCAYDIAAASNAINITIQIDDSLENSLIVFFSFFSWEILPPSLVIALVGYVPSSSGVGSGVQKGLLSNNGRRSNRGNTGGALGAGGNEYGRRQNIQTGRGGDSSPAGSPHKQRGHTPGSPFASRYGNSSPSKVYGSISINPSQDSSAYWAPPSSYCSDGDEDAPAIVSSSTHGTPHDASLPLSPHPALVLPRPIGVQAESMVAYPTDPHFSQTSVFSTPSYQARSSSALFQ